MHEETSPLQPPIQVADTASPPLAQTEAANPSNHVRTKQLSARRWGTVSKMVKTNKKSYKKDTKNKNYINSQKMSILTSTYKVGKGVFTPTTLGSDDYITNHQTG